MTELPDLLSTMAAQAVPLNELLNIAHNRPYSLLFGNYSWMMGMAGGIALFWVFNFLTRKRRHNEESEPIYQLAMPLCVALIFTGFMNVLSETQQQSRMIYGYIQGWNYWETAIIKYGIILLPLFLASSWWLTFQCINKPSLDHGIRRLPKRLIPLADFVTLWGRHYSVFDYPRARRAVFILMTILGFFAPMYSGIYLMYEHGMPVWNQPSQPLMFLCTGIADGAAIFMVFAPFLFRFATGKWIPSPNGEIRWIAVIALGVAAITWLGWMWWMSRLGRLPDQQFSALIYGPYRSLTFWHWEIIGLAVPLLLLATPLGKLSYSRWIAGVAILWGSYSIRIIVLLGVQSINRSGAGYLAFGLEEQVIYYSIFSVLLLAGLLSLLLLLPYGHPDDPHWTSEGDKQ